VDPGSAQPEPEVDPFPATAAAAEGGQPASTNTLRARGEELLRRSADIRYQEDAHPAYDRILGELAPDVPEQLEELVMRCLALKPEGARSGGVMMSRVPFVNRIGRRSERARLSRSIVSIARHAWRTV